MNYLLAGYFFWRCFSYQTNIFHHLKKLTIMAQTQTITKSVATIGEEIGSELGTQMIRDYQVANQNDVQFYEIGKNILGQILAQPGCEGIRFYNAYNEMGQKTLVYVGLNSEGKAIMEYTCVNNHGILETNKGIVADRIKTGGGGPVKGGNADDWSWTID